MTTTSNSTPRLANTARTAASIPCASSRAGINTEIAGSEAFIAAGGGTYARRLKKNSTAGTAAHTRQSKASATIIRALSGALSRLGLCVAAEICAL